MAIPATQVWEVRPTNGTANAGGGFDTALIAGSDFSQQNSVQVAFDGAVIFAATGGVDSTITITGYTPLLNDVGNALAITAGTNFTTGIYSIRTSNPGAASWTLDRSCTTGAGAAMTGNMGGARLGFNSAGSPVNSLSSAYVAGNTIWVKKESWNEGVVLNTAGAGGSPVSIVGYNATRGDITLGDGNANNPVNNRASAAGDGISYASLTALEFRNINVTAAGDGGFTGAGGAVVKFVNCRSFANTNEGMETSGGHTINAIGCELDSNGSVGTGGANATNFNFLGCYIHDNGASGIQGTTGSLMLSLNIFDSNAGNSITATSPSTVIISANTCWNNSGANADHLNFTTPSGGIVVSNIFANASRFGVNMTDGDSVFGDYNCYSGNVSGAHANFSSGAHDTTTNPLFTLASNGDFSIGATLSGFPGVFPSGKSTGFLRMGAVQPQGGASSTIINICNSVVL